MRHLDYVAIGDSFTEGVGDHTRDGHPRGFADRLADALAQAHGDVRYANLSRPSVRTAEIQLVQVPEAVVLRPNLVTVVVGVNDVIALRFDAHRLALAVTALFTDLIVALPDSRIVTATLPDISRISAAARVWDRRVRAVNGAILSGADALGIDVVDLSQEVVLTPDDLALDRIHPSTSGHHRIAAAFATTLDLPGSSVQPAGQPEQSHGMRASRSTRLRRTVAAAPPFLARRVARHRLIVGAPAKRPTLVEV